MITPEMATTALHVPERCVALATTGWVPRITPAWATPSRKMAKVGGVMLVSSAPGIPTIATGYQPIQVTAISAVRAVPEIAHPVAGEMGRPAASRLAHQ